MLLATNAQAVPVQATYIDSTDCDSHGAQFPSHELGTPAPTFPIDELIDVSVNPGPLACVPDDGAPNDFIVSITNLSSIAYVDLFFVVDSGSSVGNFDGFIEDLTGPPGAIERAFKIDGTVTPGINSNLVSESIFPNEIFEPGETWMFLVSNFLAPASLPPFPVLGSAGEFAATSGSTASNASILASPIPEPSTGLLVALGLGGLCLRRRFRARPPRSLGLALVVVTGLAFAGAARANPVSVQYQDDPRCDALPPSQVLIDEIGLPSAGFPAGEALASSFTQGPEICAGNGIAADDFEVSITNLTAFDFADVFFVADLGIPVGNADGVVIGGGAIQDAFRIDAFGLNANLVFESGSTAGIWESGETWRFLVTDFGPGLGVAPIFGSLGVLGATAPGSTASIVAGQVIHEPSTGLLFGLGLAGVALSGRRRRLAAALRR